jgi:lipoprotein-releasing system permease protein
MGGFQKQIKDTLLQADAHVLIRSKPKGNSINPIKEYRSLQVMVQTNPKVISATPFIKGDGLLRRSGFIKPIQIRGVPVDTAQKPPQDIQKIMVDYFGEKLKVKSRLTLPAGNQILVGYELKNEFNLDYGTRVELIVPQGDLTAKIGLNPVIKNFTVCGFFKTGYYQYDTNLVYISLGVAQNLYGLGDRVFGIALKIKDLFESKIVRDEIIETLGSEYSGYTIEELNENLFTALQLEKGVMSILLFLIIIAAAFNITGTLIWVVMDKRKSIGILKSMGATSRSILGIFLFEGFIIGLLGTFFGTILGTITAMKVEKIIGFTENSINLTMGFFYKNLGLIWKKITIIPPIYYVEGFPSQVEPHFVLWVICTTLLLTTLAGLVPAWQAAKLHPVETIRYE